MARDERHEAEEFSEDTETVATRLDMAIVGRNAFVSTVTRKDILAIVPVGRIDP
eukprot:CAMPEP_0119264308 /NCGR_PEP_ID=MMETSP1329-20130426/3427_1 /TAXON_ID=114041 /ORGANISM="Genus nov. species nov., Strain RCC1024" /LENGTH=53 /DNA_ID=CAMNT_0007264063 /DNA_START=175 /DNA_END=336 /DNA_ORIENTATION=+